MKKITVVLFLCVLLAAAIAAQPIEIECLPGTDPSTCEWIISEGLPLGQYTATLDLTNEDGAATAQTATFAVVAGECSPPPQPAFGIAIFELACPFGRCEFEVEIGYIHKITTVSSGVVRFDYDWDGDGDFEDSGHAVPLELGEYLVPGCRTPSIRGWSADVQVVTKEGNKICTAAAAPPPTPPPSTPDQRIPAAWAAAGVTFPAELHPGMPYLGDHWPVEVPGRVEISGEIRVGGFGPGEWHTWLAIYPTLPLLGRDADFQGGPYQQELTLSLREGGGRQPHTVRVLDRRTLGAPEAVKSWPLAAGDWPSSVIRWALVWDDGDLRVSVNEGTPMVIAFPPPAVGGEVWVFYGGRSKTPPGDTAPPEVDGKPWKLRSYLRVMGLTP